LKRPTMLIPTWFALATAPLSSLYYRMQKRQPLYSYYSIKTLSSNSLTTHRKASEALGYTARPIRESIVDTVKWHRTHKKNIKKTAYVSACII
jgi:dihydroflavonol-4-reductase